MHSVRFVVLGVMALVTARSTVMDTVIESAARGVMDQEEECKFNKLTSVFHSSVLLLTMNFVITLSK